MTDTFSHTPVDRLNRSALMSAYNYAKAWARRSSMTTPERVDRALGYLMNGDAETKWAEYLTGPKTCGCPDHIKRGLMCKHSLALAIVIKHDQIMDTLWIEREAEYHNPINNPANYQLVGA